MMAEIQALTALAVFQACLNAALVAIVLGLVVSPEHLARARRWVARLRRAAL